MSRNLSYLLFVAFILAALSSPAAAQTVCPDVSGAWSSEGRRMFHRLGSLSP